MASIVALLFFRWGAPKGKCTVAPGRTRPKTGLKKKRGFGAASPTTAGNRLGKQDQKVREQRLGKRTHMHRKELLQDVAEQPFKVGNTEVRLAVPAYVMDYAKFAEYVDNGVGTVADIVWPAEQALADALMERRHLWESAGVCELGAGLGLAGIATAVAGAPRVLLTDRDKDILRIASNSTKLNGVSDVVTVKAVDWCDSRTWPNATGAVVVAADVLYDKEVVAPLADLIVHLGGDALMMEPVNDERLQLGSVKKFEAVARERGLSVYVEDLERHGSPMQMVSVSRTDRVVNADVTEVLDPSSQTWVRST